MSQIGKPELLEPWRAARSDVAGWCEAFAPVVAVAAFEEPGAAVVGAPAGELVAADADVVVALPDVPGRAVDAVDPPPEEPEEPVPAAGVDPDVPVPEVPPEVVCVAPGEAAGAGAAVAGAAVVGAAVVGAAVVGAAVVVVSLTAVCGRSAPADGPGTPTTRAQRPPNSTTAPSALAIVTCRDPRSARILHPRSTDVPRNIGTGRAGLSGTCSGGRGGACTPFSPSVTVRR